MLGAAGPNRAAFTPWRGSHTSEPPRHTLMQPARSILSRPRSCRQPGMRGHGAVQARPCLGQQSVVGCELERALAAQRAPTVSPPFPVSAGETRVWKDRRCQAAAVRAPCGSVFGERTSPPAGAKALRRKQTALHAAQFLLPVPTPRISGTLSLPLLPPAQASSQACQ